ncbi:energy transducer TonB [Sphingobacterium sp. CZ-2]|uniref:energy transducer TonB n=1 Tax=Sphingobacterium sp. CZ-2 TaxID=2557994 RepID=UPI0010702279|nr:energy transducer TonB [Sphingobacterium sp. CZ-2]QBR12305.1 hypothetical protein E3D81_09080 [Sphingobacterium sp. CZ-2]
MRLPIILSSFALFVVSQLLFVNLSFSQEVLPAKTAEQDTVYDSTSLENFGREGVVAAEPLKGMTNFRKMILNNYRLPASAISNGVNGKVICSFVITKEGKLTDVKIVQQLGHGTGEELRRVIRSSSKKYLWKPGTVDGQPKSIRYNIPFTISTH